MKFAFAAAVLALCVTTPAAAEDWYARASVGLVESEGNVSWGGHEDGSTNYALAIGREIWGPFRVEAGASHTRLYETFGVVPGRRVFLQNVMDYSATLYADAPVSSRLDLFVGAGVDYLTSDNVNVNYDGANGDGWHWTAGAAYDLTSRLTAEVSYRQTSAEFDFEHEFSPGNAEFEFRAISVGARYLF